MSLDRTNMGSIDKPNFDLLKGFFDSSWDEEKNDEIKSFIEATRANRDVRVWYKQCIPRKLCTLALTLKLYLGIWYIAWTTVHRGYTGGTLLACAGLDWVYMVDVRDAGVGRKPVRRPTLHIGIVSLLVSSLAQQST